MSVILLAFGLLPLAGVPIPPQSLHSLRSGPGSAQPVSATWTAESDQADSAFGRCIAAAGDVNGDGYADLLVGAPGFDNGQATEGRAHLYLGSPAGPSSVPDWTAESDEANAHFGGALAGVGDVNGDGYDDVIIGASEFHGGLVLQGRASVYLGSPSGLPPVASWTILGGVAFARLGRSVSGLGDVNGDGYDDVVVTAQLGGEGRALVFLGSSSGLGLMPAWSSTIEPLVHVARAGDVNGDGYDDLIGVGDYGAYRVHIYLGSPIGLAATAQWTVAGDTGFDLFGFAVCGIGDVDGDGFDDLLVGASQYEGNGAAHFYRGSGVLPSLVPE